MEDTTCECCGGSRIERYPVLRVRGWKMITRCQDCLTVLRSEDAPTPLGFTYLPYGSAGAEPFAPKRENLAPPACFGLTEPLRGFQGARRGLELRAPAELIAPTAEAEAEPFAPKKEKLAPLPVLA